MPSDTMVLELHGEWKAALQVQQSFMQASGPITGNLSYAARCRQMCEVGGDCYHFSPIPHDRLGFFIGDASGQGLAAALMISNVQSSFCTAAGFVENDPAAVIGAVNRQVHW